MQNYNTEYKDYSKHVVVMISTDQLIFNENSAVRLRMKEYAKQYKELHIIIFSRRKLPQQKISDNCIVYSTNSHIRWNYVSDACRIGKRIVKDTLKVDPLLVTCQDPFETALVGKCLANLKRSSELLIQIHTDLYSPYFAKISILNRIRLFIAHFTIPHAQVIRVVSNRIADSLVKRGVDSNKIIVKPIDTQIDTTQASFNLRQKYSQFNKIIILVSRLESEKNIKMAIDAFALVQKEKPQAGLVIVGSGREMGSLKSQAKKLGMENSVVFEGWQTDLLPYYKGSDILLVTSWYEGYGMVFKEAQAFGLKIVSTDVGIAKEVGATIVAWDKLDIARGIIQNI